MINILKNSIKKINSWLCQLFIFLVTTIVLLLAGCSDKASIELSGPIMGTQYNITLACQSDRSVEQWQAEVLPVMESINQSMSTYIVDSELSLFNQSQSTEFQKISSPMVDVLSVAQRVSRETNGAFDVTVMPLVNLWGFGPRQNHLTDATSPPSDEQLSEVKAVIGYEKLELDRSFTKWRKTHQSVSVDFSSVAKGYAVDQVSNKLQELGCVDHLVDIGGELRVSGNNKQGKPWRLAIEKPHISGGIQVLIDVTDISVASSGDYRNFYELDGQRYSHTIDPRTLKPIEHNLASVTVLDPIASRADALATAFMVMGNEAIEFAQSNQIPAFFIFRSPQLSTQTQQQYQVLYSQAFEKYISTR